MVVDYRRLNMQTVKDRFPLPVIDDLLDRLASNQLFCTLDMAHGYFQIPLNETSAIRAAFTTKDGHLEPTRLFFHFANEPPIYQRMVTRVFGPFGWGVATCYLDDILIPSKDFPEVANKL